MACNKKLCMGTFQKTSGKMGASKREQICEKLWKGDTGYGEENRNANLLFLLLVLFLFLR